MSERDSDRDPRRGPWRDEPGASVFDRPGGGRPGGPGGPGGGAGGGPGGSGSPGGGPDGSGWPGGSGGSGDERTQAMPDGGGGGSGWPPPQPRPPGAHQGPPGGQVHIPAPPEPPPEVPTRPDADAWAPRTQAYGQAPGGYAPPYDPTPGYEQWPGDPGPGPGPGGGPGPGPGSGAGEGRRRPRRPRGEGRPSGGEGMGFPFGLGALLGVAGLVGVLLSLLSLPWFTVAGQDVTLSDIRTAYEAGDEAPGTEDEPAPEDGSGPTLPEDVTSPGEVGDAVRDEVSDAAGDAAAAAVDSGKARYLELYVERLWLYVAIGTGLAVLFSTILAPRSFALGLLLGFRRLSGFVTLVAAGAHGAALWVLFTGDGSPDPTTGVWIGVAGFVGVFAGCVVGPKR